MLCLLSCGEQSTATTVLSLRVHSLRNCDLPPDLSRANLQLLALGDFEASNESAEILPIDAGGTPLKFPGATRAVEAQIRGRDSAFFGYGERSATGGLDLLLWPEAGTCTIWPPGRGKHYPGRYGGQALGYAAASGIALAVGGSDALVTDAIVGALTFNVARGELLELDAGADGVLQKPRAFATVTPFGDDLLVAGGEQPVFGVPELDIEPQSSAEIFDTKRGRFSGELIELGSSRTHHAALALDDGRTLLIGGRTKVGSTNIAQYRLEIVDPSRKRASIADAVAARIDPRALRLSDGRIFIAGGTTLDGALTQPVAQWLTREARLDSTTLSLEVAPRFERAFVATDGGGVLAVGGCEDRPASSDEDAQACAASCSHGCPPLRGYDAWWIDSSGDAIQVPLDDISAPRPILLPGSDGRPWLVAASSEAPAEARLFRFNPWSTRFEPIATPASSRLPRPDMPAPLSLGSDTFVWIDDADAHAELRGLRLGTRSRYAQDLALVLQSDPLGTRPEHLVPSRPLGQGAQYDGALELRGAAFRAAQDPPDSTPDVVVRVADTDYADVTIELHVSTDELPRLLLGDTALGGASCPWPSGKARGGNLDLPTVVRSGQRAELRFHGAARVCAVEPGRLTLGLVASDGISRITELDVKRVVSKP